LAVKVLRRLKAFSPLRRKERKERKGRQELWTCILLFGELSVFAVKVLCFVFQKNSE